MSSKRLLALQEDGTVLSLTMTVDGVGQMGDFFKVVKDHMTVDPIFLPHADRGCVFLIQKENRRAYFMHLDARKRIILYQDETSHENFQYELILPPTYVAIFFRGGAIEASYAIITKKPIESMEDQAGIMPFPNISLPYGAICIGGKVTWSAREKPEKTAASYLEYFLASNFTSHINQHFDLLPNELAVPATVGLTAYARQKKIFENWQKLSKEGGRDAVENLDWKTQFTLGEMIKKIWEGKK